MDQADLKYKEYISGKKVAFVAPARAFIGSGKGPEIDACDIVVRTNHFPFILDDYAADFGARCDVLYINMQYCREMFPVPIGELKKRGVEWMCFKGLSQENRTLYSKHFKVRQILPDISRKVAESVQSYTYGNYIWTEILCMGPRELLLFNTDFFAYRKKHFGPDLYDNYLPGYLTDNIINQANQINVNLEKYDHDFLGNASYTAGLFRAHKNFKADSSCAGILGKIMNGEIDQR